MSHFPLNVQQSSRPFILGALAILALSVSACGQETEAQESRTPSSMPKWAVSQALDGEPCAAAANGQLPTLSVSDSVITLQCGVDTWVAPDVTAVDACGQPLAVHKYNTGDDDGDGIPGSIDPDDFGPGPDTSVEGVYEVQYLAWDEFYNIQGAILQVHVVNCSP